MRRCLHLLCDSTVFLCSPAVPRTILCSSTRDRWDLTGERQNGRWSAPGFLRTAIRFPTIPLLSGPLGFAWAPPRSQAAEWMLRKCEPLRDGFVNFLWTGVLLLWCAERFAGSVAAFRRGVLCDREGIWRRDENGHGEKSAFRMGEGSDVRFDILGDRKTHGDVRSGNIWRDAVRGGAHVLLE